MKKLALFFLGLALISGCKKKDIPLGPGNIGQEKPENTPPTVLDAYSALTGTTEFGDADTNTTIFEDAIRILFSEPVDQSTIDTTNIEVKKVINGKIQAGITGSVAYYPESRVAEWTPQNGFVNDDSTSYLLIVHPGVQDIDGNSLDGNENGVSEGDPWDSYNNAEFAGPDNPNPIEPDFNPPYWQPEYPDTTIPLDNDVITTPTIKIWYLGEFRPGPNSGGDINPSTIQASDITLTNYQTGASRTLNFSIVDTTSMGYEVDFTLQSGELTYSTVYMIIVKNTVQDSAENYLDVNGNGIQESGEADTVFFATEKENNDPTDFPEVESVTKNQNEKNIHVRFSKKMDITTFTQANIQVYTNQNRTGLIPGEIYPDIDNKGFRKSLIGWTGGTVYLFISINVQCEEGFPLDGNGDNIGGVEHLDYYFGPQ